MCKKNEGIVMSNFAALRAAVFKLFSKNLRGGGYPPPVGARVKLVSFNTKFIVLKATIVGMEW